jgi:hypothetical protein
VGLKALLWFYVYDVLIYYDIRVPVYHSPIFQATSKEGKEGGIEIIQPPANSKPGDRVYFEGSDFESRYWPCTPSITLIVLSDATPLSQLNPKKKIFEAVQPGTSYPLP